MPAPIDMSIIQQALARRGMGGAPAGGGAMPASGQVSAPGAPLPTGGPNTPTTPPAQPAPVDPANMATRQAAGGTAQAAQVAQGPNFDDETKKISKALVTKLIQYL